MDHNYNIGNSSFLPPINMDSKKNLERIPLLKLDQGSSKQNIERMEQNNGLVKGEKIHAFDPKNLSLPEYSSKYQNESNHAAVSHLLGGRGCANASDLRASNV